MLAFGAMVALIFIVAGIGIQTLMQIHVYSAEEDAAVASVVTNEPAVATATTSGTQITPGFVEGFEAGVQWGITSYMRNPKNASVGFHALEAKRLYWLVVVDEGRTLLEMAAEKRAKGE